MARVYGLTPNFAGDSVLSCQQFQENVNQIRNAVNHVRKTVNLFSKLPVNHIRKNRKNCQPKSGKDKVTLNLGIGATIPFYGRLRESGHNHTYMTMHDHVKPFVKMKVKYSLYKQ